MKWTNVKNLIPIVDGHYLVYSGDWDGITIALFVNGVWRDIEQYRDYQMDKTLDSGDISNYVTHWMKLPDIPK